MKEEIKKLIEKFSEEIRTLYDKIDLYWDSYDDEDYWYQELFDLQEKFYKDIESQLQQELDEYKYLTNGEVGEVNFNSCLINRKNGFVKFDDLFRYLNGEQIEIYIKQIGKEE